MPELVIHARPVATVFDLLGHDENDMTAALGWGLTRSGAFLRRFAGRLAAGVDLAEPIRVELQEHGLIDRGFTDIELVSAGLHVIIEAKRGWDPPSEGQLRRYEGRFVAAGRPVQCMVVLTQNGAEHVVRHRLGPWSPAEPIAATVLGWSDLVAIAQAAGREGPFAERRVSNELATYLRGVADMRDADSNSVYVVALAANPWQGCSPDLTPIDVVAKHCRYFFPALGKNWPKAPPNYLAFRYWGKLQSIHHVDHYTIVDSPHPDIPGAPDLDWEEPHFLLTLGPAIRPGHEVRTGPGIRQSARVWADIDLLLTSDTITEASAQTRARRVG